MRNDQASHSGFTSIANLLLRGSLVVLGGASVLSSYLTMELRGSTAHQQATSPHVLWWQDSKTGRRATPVGVLYSPETLASLAAARPAAVSNRVKDAISKGTPIVIMWAIPESAQFGQWRRPFRVAIVENGGDVVGQHIEPIWADDQPNDLSQLDAATEYKGVGVVAAFSRDAFLPGRWVVIYAHRNDGRRTPQVQRWGTIEWDGRLSSKG